ncbi:putative hydrolase or acyltransferase of alpha/beta superfamily [Leptolyngbya sp. PCC 7375]|nr:putative hydrolase or acyltransferase of alpha/beta superfamily [Leptolyngbya sp. PCC 7375]
MIKWLRRLTLVAAAILFLALITGFVYEQWSRHTVAQSFSPPGELVAVNGKLSHLYCTGEGSPTIVLESGINEGGSLVWEAVRPAISQVSRVCAYDQSGIMWSERREQPRDADHIVQDLHDLLMTANEPPPYVMVGHSLGGLIIRVFTNHFHDEVVGLIFVDSSHPEQNQRFPEDLMEIMAYPPTLLLRTISTLGILRLQSPPAPSALPKEAGKAIHDYLPESMTGIADEIAAMDTIFAQAQSTGPFGDIPMVVLTAGHFPDELPYQLDADNMAKLQSTWSKIWPVLQTEIAALSTNSDHRTILESSHNIPYEAPEAIVEAIKDVVMAQREGKPHDKAMATAKHNASTT